MLLLQSPCSWTYRITFTSTPANGMLNPKASRASMLCVPGGPPSKTLMGTRINQPAIVRLQSTGLLVVFVHESRDKSMFSLFKLTTELTKKT